jgi:ribosomal protein S9
VFDPQRAASEAGLAIELADLGDWGGRLVSEYDPHARAIRINERALDAYRRTCGVRDVRSFIALAVAHELYHRFEAAGSVRRGATRAQREAAADAYARACVAVDARLAAFLEPAAAT